MLMTRLLKEKLMSKMMTKILRNIGKAFSPHHPQTDFEHYLNNRNIKNTSDLEYWGNIYFKNQIGGRTIWL